MSKAVLFKRHGKESVDQAVSQIFMQERDPRRRARFGALLHLVRDRSSLLSRPTVCGNQLLEIEAIANLASFRVGHVRPPSDWKGWEGSPLTVVASLANHLFAQYPVPTFLGSVWFGERDGWSIEKRRWFVSHGNGARFRELGLPIAMTRRMERIFLASPDHLEVERALRRAELMGLDAGPELVEAVLATRLGRDLAHGAFWRSFVTFSIRYSLELDFCEIERFVEFLQFVRHEPVEVHGPEGRVARRPRAPDFSLRGRTPSSLSRLIDRWYRDRGRSAVGHLSWEPSGYESAIFLDPAHGPEAQPVRWEFLELTNSADLDLEGKALRHCVGSYAYDCRQGYSRIWSLRRTSQSNKVRSIATIEIDPSTRTVVQAKGFQNRPTTGKARRLLEVWARRANLRLAV